MDIQYYLGNNIKKWGTLGTRQNVPFLLCIIRVVFVLIEFCILSNLRLSDVHKTTKIEKEGNDLACP